MITTGRYNLTIQNGESYTRDFKLLEYNNVPFDLTGYTITSWIKVSPTDAQPTAQFTASSPVPTDGAIRLQLSPSASAQLTGSCYQYDIRITSGSDVAIYPLEGKVLVSPSITK
jgi:hypothetical protein